MNDKDILAAIVAMTRQETGNLSLAITSDMMASDSPGWDSLAHVRILLGVGAMLGISIDIEKTYRAATIGDLVPIIKRSYL